MASAAALTKLLADFPCLIPCDSAFSEFAGFVQISGREFRIRIASDCSRFEADYELQALLEPSSSTVQRRLKATSSVRDFLVEIRDIVERHLTSRNSKEQKNASALDDGLPCAGYYDLLLSQITSMGWEYVSELDQQMRTLEIVVRDNASREHMVRVSLPSDYPRTEPICTTSLPEELQLDWSGERTLSAVRSQFASCVETFADVFRALDDFDAHTRVLEPERPTRRDIFRRIALDRHASVRVQLDARDPIRTYAQCRFLGSDKATTPLRRRLNERMHLWDTSGDVLPRENLQNILGIEFQPMEDSNNSQGNAFFDGEQFAIECGICYTYRLDDRVPDVACDRPECAKPYHRPCLVEWLRALPDTRESFGTLTGKCVYCEEAMSVAIKED